MRIFISTLGRAKRQITLSGIPEPWLSRTKLVIVKKEYKEHAKLYGKKRLLVLPSSVPPGLSPHRQWLLENADKKRVWFLDDDLRFYYRHEGIKLKPCERDNNDENVGRAFMQMGDWLSEGIALVGLSLRQSNHFVEEDYKDNTRIMSCYAFNRDILIKEGIRFDRIQAMQDFDVTLALLRKGHRNRVSHKYCYGEVGGRSAPGGCTTYRNEDFIKKAAIRLADLHPGLVSVVPKVAKSSWKEMGRRKGLEGSVRVDVNIAWGKAFRKKAVRRKDGVLSFVGGKK